MRKIIIIISMVFILCGCGYKTVTEIYSPDYTTEISVFSIISTDNGDEFVIVERTMQLNENDESIPAGTNTIIDDADVYIIGNGDTVQFTFYREPENQYNNYTYSSKGMYLDVNNEFRAQPGKTYRLVVITADGSTVTGTTTVPDIPEISQPVQWSSLPKRDIKDTSVEWQDNPNTLGYKIDFIIEFGDYNEKLNISYDYFVTESPAKLWQIDDYFLLYNVLPLSSIATIRVIALDQNSYDYLTKSELATLVGTDLNLLDGGIGVFGSFSVDQVKILLQ